jgi:replicative DNA helicase
MTRPADVCGAADLVPVGWINDPHIRQVYRVAVLEATQGRVDTSALPAVMMRHGLPSTAVGIYTGLVVDLLSGVPLPENWRGYASTIIDTRLRQEVAEIGRRLAHEAQQLGHAELVALTDQAADQVRQLSDRLLALHGRPA